MYDRLFSMELAYPEGPRCPLTTTTNLLRHSGGSERAHHSTTVITSNWLLNMSVSAGG